MRQRKPIRAKVLKATANGLEFTGEKKISTAARIKFLLNELNIDADVFKFQAAMRAADRLIKTGQQLNIS